MLFAGVGLKLSELKAAIIQKRGLQTAAMTLEGKTVDLTVRNAVTNYGVCAKSALQSSLTPTALSQWSLPLLFSPPVWYFGVLCGPHDGVSGDECNPAAHTRQ